MHPGRFGRLAVGIGCAVGVVTIAAGQGGDPIPQLRWLGGNGVWSNPQNWTPPVVPGPDQWVLQVNIDRSNPIQSNVTQDSAAWVRNLAIDPNDTLTLQSGQTLKMNVPGHSGRITNSGHVFFADGASLTQILLTGGIDMRLRGGGVVTLGNAFTSRITGEQGTEHLINENNIIEGAGLLGVNGLSIDNLGTIDANAPYKILRIDPNANGFVNTGALLASDNGRLELLGGVFDNTGGLIAADSGGRVDLSDATVFGGTLSSSNGGTFRVTNLPVTWQNLEHAAFTEIGPAELVLRGSISNAGLVSIVGDDSLDEELTGGSVGLDASAGPIVLDGPGEMAFVAGSALRNSTSSAAAFIHGSEHTISGSVLMNFNVVTLSNSGTIIADQPDLISIDLHDSIPSLNNGTMRATGSGGLVLFGGIFTNNGIVEVTNGSRVVFAAGSTVTNTSGGVLSGGTWNVLSEGATTSLIMSSVDFLVNDADVTLSGPGAYFPEFEFVVLNDGSISILNGRNYVTDIWFSNHQSLTVGADTSFAVSGAFSQSPSGTLRLEVPGANSEAGPAVVTVAGAATLAGTLELWTADGSTPVPGQSYQLLTATSINGAFSSIVSDSPVEISYAGGAVTVSVVAACPGDFNDDGIVDSIDMGILFSNWGPCPAPPSGCPWDLNGNGNVGMNDWLILNNYWGPCD